MTEGLGAHLFPRSQGLLKLEDGADRNERHDKAESCDRLKSETLLTSQTSSCRVDACSKDFDVATTTEGISRLKG